jgi:hypothetical protein
MGAAADMILRALAPVIQVWSDSEPALDAIAAALMAPVELVDQVVRDTATIPAWQAIRDPDAAPAEFLPWLAQHVGVQLQPGDSEVAQRARISQTAGFDAGTVKAIVTNVQRTLTGTKTVRVLERVSGDPWAMTVITRTSETPDAAAAQAAALEQTPAWIVLTFVTSNAPLIDEGTRIIDAGTATIDTATLADVT